MTEVNYSALLQHAQEQARLCREEIGPDLLLESCIAAIKDLQGQVARLKRGR